MDDCNSGDAPSSYHSALCIDACILADDDKDGVKETILCDLGAKCIAPGGDTAYVVADYGSNADNDYTAFGSCDGSTFCCTIEQMSAGEITDARILGSPDDDVLSFTWGLGNTDEAYLRSSVRGNAYPPAPVCTDPGPIHDEVFGLIEGGDGDDEIVGSNHEAYFCDGWYYEDDYAEELSGQMNDDTIYALRGDDVVHGGGGADTLYGGDGDDTITGGSGVDDINGGYGDDTIEAGSGGDTVSAGPGNDTVRGQDGADELSGGSGDDILYGGRDNDILQGDANDDQLDGGDGDDTLDGGSDDDLLCDHTGIGTAAGNTQVLIGGTGVDRIWYGEATYTANAAVNGLDLAASNAGSESGEECGDDSVWAQVELPPGCDSYTSTRPGFCSY